MLRIIIDNRPYANGEVIEVIDDLPESDTSFTASGDQTSTFIGELPF